MIKWDIICHVYGNYFLYVTHLKTKQKEEKEETIKGIFLEFHLNFFFQCEHSQGIHFKIEKNRAFMCT